MELKIRVANPAGNITIFVLNKVPRKDYIRVANALMSIKSLRAEQVGFVTHCKSENLPRLEMMGGEFCGNATRSFGYLQGILSGNKPRHVCVSASGNDKPLTVELDHKNGACTTEMPIPIGISVVPIITGDEFPMVISEGIDHIIIDATKHAKIMTDKKEITEILKAAREVHKADAYGLMFLIDDSIKPLVYVVSTDTLIWEGSCGSGSVACGYYQTWEKPNGTHKYKYKQPGGEIDVIITKKYGKISMCKMGGPITMSEEMTVNI